MPKFVKIRPLAVVVCMEGQVDMTKLTPAFLNFANAPKMLRPESIRSFSDDSVGQFIHAASGKQVSKTWLA
jgi:hypothetical protein